MTRRFFLALFIACQIAAWNFSSVQAQTLAEFRVPEGFQVTKFAGDDLAHNVYCLALDARGRVTVSGPNYIKILVDDNRDGVAEGVKLFSTLPVSGAHGLLWEGRTLYFTGDGGLWKLTDTNEDDMADGPPQWVHGPFQGGEHGANGLARGPDGWLYLICGNDAGVDASFATTRDSPVTRPNCGVLTRFSPDEQTREIVADGFRNPYDVCFDAQGRAFTMDSDGERDYRLPWYGPTRLFEIATGRHHNWLVNGYNWSWNRPDYYFDAVRQADAIERGSPTGVTCYRHNRFPARYARGVFTACWTFGRVYFHATTSHGARVVATPEVFLETTGQVGFAPVDIAVGQEGEMYVAIGGRHTTGSVFRIDYVANAQPKKPDTESELTQVLRAPQPNEAWSRAMWLPRARKLRREPFVSILSDRTALLADQLRAVEIVTELFAPFTSTEIEKIEKDAEPELLARLAWSLERKPGDWPVERWLARWTHHDSPWVQRSAWEALLSLQPRDEQAKSIPALWQPREEEEDVVTFARLLVAARGWRGDDSAFATYFENDAAEGTLWRQTLRGERRTAVARVAGRKLVELEPTSSAWSRWYRLFARAMGDIQVDPKLKERLPGYAFAESPRAWLEEVKTDIDTVRLSSMLADSFAQADQERRYEIARLAALLELDDGELKERLALSMTADSSPLDDLHIVFCLSRMPGQHGEKTRLAIATALASLQDKMKSRGWYPSRNWPDRVADALTAHLARDPKLAGVLASHRSFHQPEQAFLALKLPREEQSRIAERFLNAAIELSDEPRWNTELLQLATTLPAHDARRWLRLAAADDAWRDAAITRLLPLAEADDRARIVAALRGTQPAIVEAAAKYLLTAEGTNAKEEELVVLLQALRSACATTTSREVRQSLVRLLNQWSGESFIIEEDKRDLRGSYRECFAWFARRYPDQAAKITGSDLGVQQYLIRAAKLNWNDGDAQHGERIFKQRLCFRCHAGATPLGPDLRGAAARFSRDDLFAAILDPNRDVAPPYQTTLIETGSGKAYNGLVVYESPESTLLLTGPETTVRIADEEITTIRKSGQSIMPQGLLNQASDEELRDLYAYLVSLKKM